MKALIVVDNIEIQDIDKEYQIKILWNIKEDITRTELQVILNYVFDQRWKMEISSSKKILCFEKDYDLIWFEFKKQLNIDLNENNINWWEFCSSLEGILSTENSLTNRIKIRSDKIPKRTKDNAEQINQMQRLKSKYSLISKNQSTKDLNKNMKMLFDGIKRMKKKR